MRTFNKIKENELIEYFLLLIFNKIFEKILGGGVPIYLY